MRRLNVKLFLYCVAGVALFAVTLFVVHELQAGNISSGLLYQARQAEQEHRLQLATRYLSRYLDFVPNDVEVRAHLGVTLADPRLNTSNRARDRARSVLEQVLAFNPERHEVRCCLVKLALDAGLLELAEEHLKVLMKALPDDARVIGLDGQWKEIKGQPAEAVAQLRRSVQGANAPVTSYVRLINLLRKMDRGQGGPNLKEAEGHLNAVFKQDPQDAGVLVAAAELAIDREKLPQAKGYLDRVQKLHPADMRVYLTRARYELRGKRWADAVAALRQGLQAVAEKDRYEVSWALANLLIDAGEMNQAKEVMAKIRDEVTTTGAADYLDARNLMQDGRWFEAAATLERVRASIKGATELTVQMDLMLGICYERLGQPAQQLTACYRAAKADPASVPARRGIVAALWALGQTDQAIEQSRELVKLNEATKAPSGRIELARMLLLRTLQMEKKDWRPLEEALEAADKEQPNNPEAVLLRAEMFAARKKLDEAAAVILWGLRTQPRHLDYWTALASLAERKGELEKAKGLLDKAEEQAGDSVELRLARARFWAGRPAAQSGPALKKLERTLPKESAELRGTLLNGLAEAHLRAGNPAEAARLWSAATKLPQYARDLRLRLLLFDLAMQRKDDRGMEQALEQIRAIEGGESAMWLFGRASRRLYQARQGQRQYLAEARTLLDKVVTLRPAWPAVLLAKAELEQLEGNGELAIANYRRAVEAGVRSPRVIRQLVELLTSRQRYDEAEAELRKLQKQAPLPAELQRMHDTIALRYGDLGAAEKVLRDSAVSTSNDYHDLIWTARVLSLGNRRSGEAEKALRRAVELADGVPETWVALVSYLSTTGQTTKAEVEIAKARVKLTGPGAALALAQCYEAAGKTDKAREQFQTALKDRPQDVQVRRNLVGFCLRTGAMDAVEPHLLAILQRKVNASDADVAWARRALALTLSSTANHNRLPDALKLMGLGVNAKGDPVDGPAPPGGWSAEDQVARARVLATQSRRSFRARAVELLVEVHKREALSSDDQMLLAQLYQGMGDDDVAWAKARDLMQALTTTHPRNPTYLSYFARALLQHGDYHEAERIVARLEQVEKGQQSAAGAVELKALVLERRGKVTQALAVLKAYAEAPGARPDRMLLYAGLLGRVGRLKEAIDLCEQARKTCPPEIVGGASAAVLREARPPVGKPAEEWKAQASRVEGWVREERDKAPQSVRLVLQLADLLDMLDRTPEAVKLYEEVLQREPANAVAMNNLSWLLAQQKDSAPRAVALIGQAIEVHGPRPELLDTRAVAYLTLGQTEQAIADLQRAIGDAPSPTKYFHLTRAQHMARNVRAARAALARATAAGLTADRLHPAEREAFRQLVAELQQ